MAYEHVARMAPCVKITPRIATAVLFSESSVAIVSLLNYFSYLLRRAFYARASSTMLNVVSAARRIRVKPPAAITSRSFFSPACVPSAA
jgi:hypothetical protein